MIRDPHITFINAKGVAIVWIGALIGPAFLLIGFRSDSRTHMAIGAISLLLVLLSIVDGFKALKSGAKSDFAVSALMPIGILAIAAGVTFYAL